MAGGVFDLEICEELPGIVVLRVSGRDAHEVFRDEAGGHRWQRVPPNEKRDRVHTSTVTVAVLPEPAAHELRIDDRDLEWSTCRGSGAGGQHRNKTESAVQLHHKPSGLTVRCESERSQHQNKQTALSLLRARLQAAERKATYEAREAQRRSQVGSGERGDKIRTYRWQDDLVTDHRNGRKAPLSRILRGYLEDLR